jgi:hypothetical protein
MKSIASFAALAAFSFVALAPGAASAATVRAAAVNCYNNPFYNLANYRLGSGGIVNVSSGTVSLECPIVDLPTLPHSALTWFNLNGNDKNNAQSFLALACTTEPHGNSVLCGPVAATGGPFLGGFTMNVVLWGLSDPIAVSWYARLYVEMPASPGGGYDSVFTGYTYGN